MGKIIIRPQRTYYWCKKLFLLTDLMNINHGRSYGGRGRVGRSAPPAFEIYV